MSSSENEKARAEAGKDVSRKATPGRYEGALARVLAGLVTTAHVRGKGRPEEPAEGDQPAP